MLLISPITWNHYFVLLLAPLAIFWLNLPASIWARALFLIVVAALWTMPDFVWTLFDLRGTTARPISSLTVISYQMYALLGLFALGRGGTENLRLCFVRPRIRGMRDASPDGRLAMRTT